MGEKSIDVLSRNLQSDYICRICFEEELQHSHKLQVPCACSGTSKFAHRECIQRWCYQKGNTTCEICLQEFRPGYTAVPVPAPEINQAIEEEIVREFPNLNWDEENLEIPREDQEERTLNELLAELPNSSDDQTPSCCKSIVLIFIVLILVKHMLVVLSGGWKMLSGFRHLMVIVVRTCGYIMPMYLIMWIMILILKYHHHQELQSTTRYNNRDDEEEQPLHIRVDR